MNNRLHKDNRISYSAFKYFFLIIGLIIFCFFIYTYSNFIKGSQLICISKDDFKRTGTPYGRGSLRKVDLFLSNVYNTETGEIYDKEITIESYTWYGLSLNRSIFFDQEAISHADTLYAYLYDTDCKLIIKSEIFGLTGNQPPSKIYYYSDVLRSSVSIFIVLILVLSGIFFFLQKRYYSSYNKDEEQSPTIKFKHIIPVIIVLLILAS